MVGILDVKSSVTEWKSLKGVDDEAMIKIVFSPHLESFSISRALTRVM